MRLREGIHVALVCAVGTTEGCAPAVVAPWQAGAPVTHPASIAEDIERVRDLKTDPCEDFARYACGGLLRAEAEHGETPMPTGLHARSAILGWQLVRMLQSPAPGDRRGAAASAFYASCMKRAPPGFGQRRLVVARLRPIRAAKDLDTLFFAIGQLWPLQGFAPFGGPSVDVAADGTQRSVLTFLPPTLELPARALVGPDPALRDAYVAYADELFRAVGTDRDIARRRADEAGRAAAALAKIMAPREALLDPEDRWRPTTPAALGTVPWPRLLTGFGQAMPEKINIVDADYFDRLATTLDGLGMDVLRSHVEAVALMALAPYAHPLLSRARGRWREAVTGREDETPRELLCADLTRASMPSAVGSAYKWRYLQRRDAELAYDTEARIRRAFEAHVQSAPWADDADREFALQKLRALRFSYGWGRGWEGASQEDLVPTQGDFVAAVFAVERRRMTNEYARLGERVVPAEVSRGWAQQANAGYVAPLNAVVMSPGLFGPPLLHWRLPGVTRFAGLGHAMAHEMAHALGPRTGEYGVDGAIGAHWTSAGEAQRKAQHECLLGQLPRETDAAGREVPGEWLLGEALADVLAIEVAFAAHAEWVESESPARVVPTIPHAKQFFVTYAQYWCYREGERSASYRRLVDPHLPVAERVNLTLRNSPAFIQTMGCRPGSAMRPRRQCTRPAP